MLTMRLHRPYVLFDEDETSGGATPDVEAPAADQPVVDTPEVEAAESATTETAEQPTETPEPDESFTDLDGLPPELADRAKQMQADYTRKTQELAAERAELSDATDFISDLVSEEPNETMKAVFLTLAEKLGFDVEDDDIDVPAEGDEPDAEDTRTDREKWIDAQREAEQTREQEAAEAAREAQLDELETTISSGIAELAKADGIADLTEEETNVIFDAVLALPANEGGPDVKGAYQRWKAAFTKGRDRWVQSKGDPVNNAGGGAAGDKPDLSTPEGRQAHAARSIAASRRAQE